jgi:multiple sugar transport system substrate-binding protein
VNNSDGMTARNTLRWVLGAAFLLAAAIYLLPAPPDEARHPGRIQVVFWHGFAGEWQPIYEGMVQRFNASQTKYEVIPVSVPDADLPTKFLLSASGGATPDIFLDWDPVLGLYADKGLIQPFDDIMSPAEKAEFMRRTYPIIKRNSIYRGKIMALIDGLDLYAMYYRADDLKEIGVDEKNLPKTLEEVVALGKKLDRYDSQKRLQRIGYLPVGMVNMAPAFGGKFNRDGRIVVDTPENLAAMKFIGQANAAYGFDAVTRFRSSLQADVGPTMSLIAGNYSIMFDGEWRVKQVAQYKPDLRYWLTPMPPPINGKANASITMPNYLMIPTAAKEPKGAWEFAKFCVGFLHPEDGGRNMGEMGWLPDDPIIATSKSYLAYLRKYPKYKVFVDLMTSPNLEIPPRGPLQAFATEEIVKAEDAVVRGDATAEQALRRVEQALADERKRLRDLGETVQ